MGSSGLSRSRTSGKYHDFGSCSFPYGICLYIIIGHSCDLLYGSHIYGKLIVTGLLSCLRKPCIKFITRRGIRKLFELRCHSDFSIIKWWKIYGSNAVPLSICLWKMVLKNQFFLLYHVVENLFDQFAWCFKKFSRPVYKLLSLCVYMTVIWKLW